MAIVMVRHFNKKEDTKTVLYRGGGSIAFAAASRSVLQAVPDSKDPLRRVLESAKCNLSAKPTPLLYEIVESTAEVPRVLWHGEQSRDSGCTMPSSPESKTTKLEEAKELLLEFLGGGARPNITVMETAVKLGISITTLRRAKDKLKIRSIHDDKFGGDGSWMWALPANE